VYLNSCILIRLKKIEVPYPLLLSILKQKFQIDSCLSEMEIPSNSHTVTYKDGIHTVTLVREKNVVYELKNYFLCAVPESTASYYRDKVQGPAYDEMLYFIYKAAPDPEYLWLHKEEYDSLWPMWEKIEEAIEDAREDCFECGGKLADCGGDHRQLEECDYCHGPVGCCGNRCRDRDY